MNGPTPTRLLEDVTRRVILVGRTGLDQTLRRVAGTEIVRATDSLSAVGELGDTPAGLEDAQPIVIVGPLPVSPDPAGTAAQFVAALRGVDPRVRVMATPAAADSEAYDGVIYPDATTDRMIELIDLAQPSDRSVELNGHAVPVIAVPVIKDPVIKDPAPALEHAPDELVVAHDAGGDENDNAGPAGHGGPGDARSVDAETAAPDGAALRTVSVSSSFGPAIQDERGGAGSGGWGTAGDTEDDAMMIAEMLRGHNVRPVAMRVIARRLGLTLEWRDAEPEGESAANVWAPVALGEVPVGWIGSLDGGVSRSRLERQADWLASWLRLERQQQELRQAAFQDHLTGAWNRRYFERYLSATFDRARVARLPVTVMVFDIDYFKTYNDRFGHAAGDEILCEVVALLRSCIRPTDRVCRIGGDEFAVIFYEPDGPRTAGGSRPMSVYTIARRFQKQICEARFPKLGDELEGTLTVSGGLATYPWDGTTPEALLNRADELALESKRAGKNAITLGDGAERVCHLHFPTDEGTAGGRAPENEPG